MTALNQREEERRLKDAQEHDKAQVQEAREKQLAKENEELRQKAVDLEAQRIATAATIHNNTQLEQDLQQLLEKQEANAKSYA